MSKNRLEAFTDGVVAIIITIMVLEMKVPHGADPDDLRRLGPVFVSYLLSFMFVGIFWNHHHHLFATVERVDGDVLWRNLHLLFWLSQVPFAAGWVGENHFAATPVALYGFVLAMVSLSYVLLVNALVAQNGPGSRVALAMKRDLRGSLSVVLYAASAVVAFVGLRHLGIALQVLVAVLWFVPDRRVER